jgi:DNA adenine methylase
MTDEQHRELARVLNNCKSKVIISGYPSALYDELYSKWRKKQFDVAENVSRAKCKRRSTECLWMNF